MKAIAKYKKGKFNEAHIEHLADGSQRVTLKADGKGEVGKFRVKDLSGPNEKEVDFDTGKPITKGNL